jgi:hypothetical protein
MRVPPELAEISPIDGSFPADFQGRIDIERRMYTMTVIAIPEFFKKIECDRRALKELKKLDRQAVCLRWRSLRTMM